MWSNTKFHFILNCPFLRRDCSTQLTLRPLSRPQPAKYHMSAGNTNRADQIGVDSEWSSSGSMVFHSINGPSLNRSQQLPALTDKTGQEGQTGRNPTACCYLPRMNCSVKCILVQMVHQIQKYLEQHRNVGYMNVCNFIHSFKLISQKGTDPAIVFKKPIKGAVLPCICFRCPRLQTNNKFPWLHLAPDMFIWHWSGECTQLVMHSVFHMRNPTFVSSCWIQKGTAYHSMGGSITRLVLWRKRHLSYRYGRKTTKLDGVHVCGGLKVCHFFILMCSI